MSFQAGFITLVGRPNVGKSTLINELIGQKLSITSHRPQTTRHRIHAIDTTDQYQMIFVDTPGIHIGNKKALNAYMNRTASASIDGVDLIIWLVEPNKWTQEDTRVLAHIKKVDANTPVILCVNKIDKLTSTEQILPALDKLGKKYQASEVFPLSAFNKKDTQALRLQILKYLPKQKAIFDADYMTDRGDRFVVAEFIREKLIRHLTDELPYHLTVEIDNYELAGKVQRISACIYVDKPSQKMIIIGHQGKMLKLIGTEARQSIEGFLNRKIFLQLWVKVSQGWLDDRRSLASFGYD